jgi:hypothetical protein
MPGAVIPFTANIKSFFVFLVVVSVLNWLCVVACRMFTEYRTPKMASWYQLGGVKESTQNLLLGLFQIRKPILTEVPLQESLDEIVGASSGNDISPVQLGGDPNALCTIALRRGRSRDQSPTS